MQKLGVLSFPFLTTWPMRDGAVGPWFWCHESLWMHVSFLLHVFGNFHCLSSELFFDVVSLTHCHFDCLLSACFFFLTSRPILSILVVAVCDIVYVLFELLLEVYLIVRDAEISGGMLPALSWQAGKLNESILHRHADICKLNHAGVDESSEDSGASTSSTRGGDVRSEMFVSECCSQKFGNWCCNLKPHRPSLRTV